MQSTYLGEHQHHLEHQAELHDEDAVTADTRGVVLQKLETLKIFKESWLYEEVNGLLREKYQSLFDEAVFESNRDIRSDKLEQMKGVAFATGIFEIIENELKQQLGE